MDPCFLVPRRAVREGFFFSFFLFSFFLLLTQLPFPDHMIALLILYLSVASASTAFYRGTATSLFCDASNFAPSCPSSAHMSPVFVATHNSNYVMWRNQQMASDGVVQVAVTGGTSTIDSECKSAGSNVKDCIVGGGLGKLGTVTFDFSVSSDYPLVSAITMFAPSPDWFGGFDSMNLLDSSNQWRTNVTANSVGWDAGAKDGTTYTNVGNDQNPRVPIETLTTFLTQDGSKYPLTFQITLLRVDSSSSRLALSFVLLLLSLLVAL